MKSPSKNSSNKAETDKSTKQTEEVAEKPKSKDDSKSSSSKKESTSKESKSQSSKSTKDSSAKTTESKGASTKSSSKGAKDSSKKEVKKSDKENKDNKTKDKEVVEKEKEKEKEKPKSSSKPKPKPKPKQQENQKQQSQKQQQKPKQQLKGRQKGKVGRSPSRSRSRSPPFRRFNARRPAVPIRPPVHPRSRFDRFQEIRKREEYERIQHERIQIRREKERIRLERLKLEHEKLEILHFEREKIAKEREELARKRQHLEMERKRAEFQAVKRPIIDRDEHGHGHGRSPDNFHPTAHHGSRRGGEESHSGSHHARPVVESSRYFPACVRIRCPHSYAWRFSFHFHAPSKRFEARESRNASKRGKFTDSVDYAERRSVDNRRHNSSSSHDRDDRKEFRRDTREHNRFEDSRREHRFTEKDTTNGIIDSRMFGSSESRNWSAPVAAGGGNQWTSSTDRWSSTFDSSHAQNTISPSMIASSVSDLFPTANYSGLPITGLSTSSSSYMHQNRRFWVLCEAR